MHVDYIIVGFGLAGLAFAETLERRQKSYIVFNDTSQRSSIVAASIYNPVVLKRFSAVWDIKSQWQVAIPFYQELEKKLHQSYDDQLDIFRLFRSVEEQNNWFAACDKPVLNDYLHPEILQNTNMGIKAPFGMGRVLNTGKIKTKKLLSDYQAYLSRQGKFKNETFVHTSIKFDDNGVSYHKIKANHIVFCEGFGIKQNPFFKDLPLNGTKGELITIKAPELKLNQILKSSVFILPLGDDHYKVGATFDNNDKTLVPTAAAKKELIEKLEAVVKVPYTIVAHEAGVRPTVKDRRPLLGSHQEKKQLAILNGLGTRGVLLAPKMASLLYDHLENRIALRKEVSIDRFF